MTAIDTTFINNINGVGNNPVEATKSNKNIGKEEFLTMLVAQLQNQDPLDPMSNDDFAVNLAQFSQLEQLIDINNKMDEKGNTSGLDACSSMASYLGNEVILDSNTAKVKGCEGSSISFDLSSDVESVSVQLLNASGKPLTTLEFDGMSKGHQCLDLGHVGLADGEYTVNVTATTASGVVLTPTAHSAGIVDGFIPGEVPTLLVGGQEITLDQIKEVRVASSNVQ